MCLARTQRAVSQLRRSSEQREKYDIGFVMMFLFQVCHDAHAWEGDLQGDRRDDQHCGQG